MTTIKELEERLAAIEKKSNDKKKGFGTFSSGHKFSAFGGTSTDLTLGSKTSMYAASSVSTGMGYKSDFHAGTTVSYTMGPDWESWQKPGKTLGKFASLGRGLLRAVFSKFDFSTVKSHSFNIASEGSTDLLTKKVFLNKGSFEAYAGYDETTIRGAAGKLTYEAYVKSMERVGWVLIASNVMPTASAIGQSLASMDTNGNRDHVYGGVNTAGTINAILNGVTAIGQVSALLYALMQKDKFKDNIVPKQVIVTDERMGTFLGSRVENRWVENEGAGSSSIALNNTIKLKVSDKNLPFKSLKSSNPIPPAKPDKEVKNFKFDDDDPVSSLSLMNRFADLSAKVAVIINAKNGNGALQEPVLRLMSSNKPKLTATAQKLLLYAAEREKVGDEYQENVTSALNLGNKAASLVHLGRTLSLTKKDAMLAYWAYTPKEKGQKSNKTPLKSYVALNNERATLAFNENSRIVFNKQGGLIQGPKGKSITLKDSGVVICGELKVQGNAPLPVQKVVLDSEMNKAVQDAATELKKEMQDYMKRSGQKFGKSNKKSNIVL